MSSHALVCVPYVCIVLAPLVYELFNKVIKMLYLKTVNYPEPLILYSTFHVA